MCSNVQRGEPLAEHVRALEVREREIQLAAATRTLCMLELGSNRAAQRPRSRSALTTTDTDARLIASAASIGLSSQPNTRYSAPAATGTPSALYRNAKPRFCFMFRTVAFEVSHAWTMPRRSPFTSVTCALDIATSVPVPIAIPTSAFRSGVRAV
jgi:hypothetical protein